MFGKSADFDKRSSAAAFDRDLTLTFQNVAVEAGGEGADVEAPATDAPQDRVHCGEDAHQLAGQLSPLSSSSQIKCRQQKN